MTTNNHALNEFMANKAEFDELVAKVQVLSDDHFGALPEEVNWGHARMVESYSRLLRRILADAGVRVGE